MRFSVHAGAASRRAGTADFASSIAPGSSPEIDCIRSLVGNDLARAAEQRAAALSVGADRVLIAAGTLDEEDYLRALAEELGLLFEPLDIRARAECPIDDGRLIESAAVSLLPLKIGDENVLVVAPRELAARGIVGMLANNPALARCLRLTSAERFNRFVLRHGGKAIAARASGELRQAWPMLSAAPPRWRVNAVPLAFVALSTLAAAIVQPSVTMSTVEVLLASVFLAWPGLRLMGALLAWRARKPAPVPTGDALPVYSIIAPLYREASSVEGLLTAIERLDYPAEKLDVIFAIEGDDRETRTAIAARKCKIPLSVIPVPAGGPRTKPMALNTALPFARGAFTVIYDAEDRPEPSQLRRALQAFRAGGDDLACVQARLCIDNTADSWLARLFTAEYGGQFDVFLPGLARLGLPLPLGGSSNHFHTATLRAVHGWDPYNVTEDADLGVRLARFGYRTDIIDSTTYEEAPARIGAWLRQRTRWFKGWMQTWAVHMREPLRLKRDLGLPGFLTFQLIIGGSVLAALVHPIFLASLIYSGANGAQFWRDDDAAMDALAALYASSVVTGYVTSAFLGWLGLARRNLLSNAWVLLLTPLHWLLLSLAAWRAFFQYFIAPYAWEKTEHGLMKTSRLGAAMIRSLLELERYLTGLKAQGRLPQLSDEMPSAARRRSSRAAA